MAGPSDFERALRALTELFVGEVLALVQPPDPDGAETAEKKDSVFRRRKRVRRRAATLHRLADAILTVLAKRSGVAVSEIAAVLGTTPREIVRPMTLLLRQGSIQKTGERRGTRYSLARRTEPRARPAKARKASRISTPKSRKAPARRGVRKRR